MIEEAYDRRYLRVSANINLDAIVHNVMEARENIKEETGIMAVIKADGYGHGAVPIARAINHMVEAYAVAIVEEGIELRESGITKPILILGYTAPELLTEVIQYDLTQTVFQLSVAKQMDEIARTLGKIAKIHIKLDTGMSRIGYQPTAESIDEIVLMKELPHLSLEGIFTHMACADIKDKTSALTQFELFTNFTNELEKRGVILPMHHISNSAGTIDLPEMNLSMVRFGISLYGLYPSDEVMKDHVKLEPAMELKTHISFVKELEPGHGIGYGSTFVTKKTMTIATVPVGYGDGFPRQLSNTGRVLVHGAYAPIVGRICMDQFMIDVTDIPEVKQGDIVTLVGRDGDSFIPVEEPAELAGSFNYEFVCNVGKRIPRVYYQNGKPVSIRH